MPFQPAPQKPWKYPKDPPPVRRPDQVPKPKPKKPSK